MATTKYDVFLSYSRKDYVDAQGQVIEGNFVSKIKDALTNAGITYWFDEEGIYSGDNFAEKIVVNIEAADLFLFISSANSNNSIWTAKEISIADELHKRIIPIRIDSTPYNKKVMFRIADINFIDYFNNPEKGVEDMIRSINSFKEQKVELEKAEKERAEQERRKKEEEEKRRLEEQKQLVDSIKLQCAKLNGEETKIEIDRKSLLLSLTKVADKDQQAQLKQLIETSSLSHKKAEEKNATIIKQLDEARKQLDKSQEQQTLLQQQLDEAQKPSQEVANLKNQLNEKTQAIAQLQSQLSTTQGELETTQGELETTQGKLTTTQGELETTKDELEALQESSPEVVEKKSNKKLHFIYGSIIALLSLIALIALGSSGKSVPASSDSSKPTHYFTGENKTFTVNGVEFTMVAVDGGTFTMGATNEQGSDANDDEKPVHPVTLSPFYIGQTEVTQALWEAVMGSNPSYSTGTNKPVEKVSWNDCQDFLRKLNEITGENFKLPTEAQWEYAARGGNRSQGYKYSGSNTPNSVAWYGDNSGHATHDVGTLQGNELGIYDMSGNVSEWCEDWDSDYSSNSQTDPTGPSAGTFRVYRGGAYPSFVSVCRVSFRGGMKPIFPDNTIGLRLAL